jgi:hypothetical protein
MFSQTALMRLSYQVIESIERAMQPFIRQHAVQARNCEQDEKQQNEDGDNNLHECETALMPHPGILRRAGQITIWRQNTSLWPQVVRGKCGQRAAKKWQRSDSAFRFAVLACFYAWRACTQSLPPN